MESVKIIVINTNLISLDNLLSSSFLSSQDVLSLDKYTNLETKKEKTCSLILKNKYIGEYGFNEHGKPVSANCFFSISHSKGVVTFVIDSAPIGIDIEEIKEVQNDLIDYISSDEEKEYIKSNIKFFEIWTSKESLTKNIGTGITNNIKEIPALPINGLKEYHGKIFYTKNIKYHDYIISITREGNKPFDVEIIDQSTDI